MEQEQIESLKTALNIGLENKNKATQLINSIAILHGIYTTIDGITCKLDYVELQNNEDIILHFYKN